MQYVQLSIHQEILCGEYHSHGSAPFAVLFVHGLGSFRNGEKSMAVAQACQAAGIDFVAFDFRSHGQSSGTMPDLTASRLLEDLDAIRVYLQAQGITHVGLVGSSMGGFASAWFAVRQPAFVVGCVLLAPAFRFLDRRWESLSPAERDEWRTLGLRPLRNQWLDTHLGYGLIAEHEQFRPADLAKQWQTPTLIYQGLQDDVVPATDSLAWVQATTYPHIELRLLKDGDHRLSAYKDTMAQAAVAFLTNLNADRGKAMPIA